MAKQVVDIRKPVVVCPQEKESRGVVFAVAVKRSVLKILSVILIVSLNGAGLLTIGSTLSYFNDQEASAASMSAAILDFSLSSGSDFAPEISVTSSMAFRTILIHNDGTLDFNYSVTPANATGTLCDSLDIVAYLSSVEVFRGPLASFYYQATMTGNVSQWDFTASLPATTTDPAQENATCSFDLLFDGVQIGCSGFSDTEQIANLVTSGLLLDSTPDCLKINEVYYDPDDDHGDANDEWIELYNSCSYAVNLKNFYLEDKNGQEVIHSNYIISSGQFVVIAANASTWSYWPLIPNNATKIALGGIKLFSGMSNTDDWLALYDSSDNLLDVVAWGGGIAMFSPPVPDVDKGHSIARIVKGVDTDTASDWEDLASPNPGTNPHSAPVVIEPSLLLSEGVFLSFANQSSAFVEPELVLEELPLEQAIEGPEPLVSLGLLPEETTTSDAVIQELLIRGTSTNTDQSLDVAFTTSTEPFMPLLELPMLDESASSSDFVLQVVIDLGPIEPVEPIEASEEGADQGDETIIAPDPVDNPQSQASTSSEEVLGDGDLEN